MSGSRNIVLNLSVRDADVVRTQLLQMGQAGEAALQRLDAAAKKAQGTAGASGGGSGMAGVGSAIGQAGFQIQDFAVQVQGGTSALVALSQQGSQMLGVFGTGGAIAGAVLTVGLLALGLSGAKTEAEKFAETIKALEDAYNSNLASAEKMEAALKRQNSQYLSNEEAGRRYRAGLRDEAENLVRLTDYYARLSATQRQVASEATVRQRDQLATRGRGLLNDITDPLSGILGAQDGAQSPLSLGFIDTTAVSLSGSMQRAADAVRAFREQGVITAESVSALILQMRGFRDEGGEGARVIERQRQALEEALPRVREYEEALARLGITQSAINNDDPQAVARERGRTAISQIGGRFQQQQQLLRQRAEIQALLRDPAATAEDRSAGSSSLQAIAQSLNGLTPATEQYLRTLRLQVDLSRNAAGAARDLAAAEQAIVEAARGSGGTASPQAIAEARRLTQQRLREESLNGLEVLNREIIGQQDIAAAYNISNAAGREAEIRHQAQTDALRTEAETSERYEPLVAVLTARYTAKAAALGQVRSAQALLEQGRQLEMLEAEARLVFASTRERERELAVLRERQRILSEGGDPNSDQGQRRIENAQRMAEIQRETQQSRALYDQLASFGERSFDRIGTAITTSFVNGSDAALSFRNIAKAVISDISQEIIKLSVLNPIKNAILGTNSPVLGGGFFSGISNLWNGASASAAASIPGGIGSATASAGGFLFANGGIMTGSGPVPLRRYAGGGIANSPQLAMFGEGRTPEAYVPLPDGRRIPVAMEGGGGMTFAPTYNIDARGSDASMIPRLRAEMVAIARASNAELLDNIQRGGSAARIVGRRA